MDIKYRQFKNSDSETVAELILNLYREDPSDKPMTPEKIQRTFDSLTHHPDRGNIIVLKQQDEIVGYSILSNFWSNEFGGNLLVIDELYVRENFRGKGIGTNFIKYIIENKFNNAVALQLEATPDNVRARKLYESLGFKLHKNTMLDLVL